MIICFEEKDRNIIESKWKTIIEFKRWFYNTEKTIYKIWESLNGIVDNVVMIWDLFAEKFLEAVDSVKMVIEIIKDIHNYTTSFRYKYVKYLSKCTGIETGKLWKATRHTWLARSCC